MPLSKLSKKLDPTCRTAEARAPSGRASTRGAATAARRKAATRAVRSETVAAHALAARLRWAIWQVRRALRDGEELGRTTGTGASKRMRRWG